MLNWTSWQPMPEPKNCREITAPKGSGVYQIRNRITFEFILFGIGKECQKRMKSLYPKPYGSGNRNNSHKREYIFNNYGDLEFRTIATENREDAAGIERIIKKENRHLFNT